MYFNEDLDTRLLREKRFRMVEDQLRMRSIHDKRVLEAIKKVPRHLFVDDQYVDVAYGDHPLPISKTQHMNTPYITGLMFQALEVRPQHKVLVVGTGSGFQSALIGEVSTQVFCTELDTSLAKTAAERFRMYKCTNIEHATAKKVIGWTTKAPFDRIVVTGATQCIPKELLKQLAPKGILVLPVTAKNRTQDICKVTKEESQVNVRRLASTSSISPINNCTMTPATIVMEN